MPGKATRPDDGRHNNAGGRRPGSGRPRLSDPADSKARRTRQIRAHDDEWAVIKDFAELMRESPGQCRLAVALLKSMAESPEGQ